MNDPEKSWCSPRRFALILAALILVSFWKVLMGLETFAVRDFGQFSYPVAYFQRLNFWNGQLPFWNPLSCCGLPFLAQFNTLCLYPLSLIYLLLPLTWALPFFCLLHVFIGGLGMYFLAARWTGSRAGGALAGVAFSFGGLSLNFLMWPSHIATFAWMPWVILLTEVGWQRGGRAVVWAALAGAMQVLGGGPEEILFTWLFLGALALTQCYKSALPARILAGRFLLIGTLALALSAPQVLPFAQFAVHSSRNSNFGHSEWSMPLGGWGNFLAPLFQTSTSQFIPLQYSQYWTSSYYVGIEVIFLMALTLCRSRAWRVWLMTAFILAALVLALGNRGGVYFWMRRIFPIFGFFRYPIKFVIITSLLMPLLAAFAVRQYENPPASALPRWRLEWICAAAIVLLTGTILWFARFRPVPDSNWPATLRNALARLGFLAAFGAAIYFFARRPAQRRWSLLLLIAISWLDLLTQLPWQNPTLDPSVYQPGLGIAGAKLDPPPQLGQSRVMISSFSARNLYYHRATDERKSFLLHRVVFLADCNLLDNIPKVDGFFSLYLRDTDRVLWMLDGRTGAPLEKLSDLLGVAWTIAPGKLFDWVPRPTYLPMVTAGQEPVFASDEAAFDAVAGTNANFRDVVYLPASAKTLVTAHRQPGARITSEHFNFNDAAVQVETPTAAMVFVSQAYYGNWRASVDGKRVPLWRANYAFQAVEVPAGSHVVTLQYRDTAFWLGTLVCGLALLICVVLWRIPAGTASVVEPQVVEN